MARSKIQFKCNSIKSDANMIKFDDGTIEDTKEQYRLATNF